MGREPERALQKESGTGEGGGRESLLKRRLPEREEGGPREGLSGGGPRGKAGEKEQEEADSDKRH